MAEQNASAVTLVVRHKSGGPRDHCDLLVSLGDSDTLILNLGVATMSFSTSENALQRHQAIHSLNVRH